jgi:hypothetical protein
MWRSDPVAGCGSAAAGCTFATKSLVIDLSQGPRSRVAKSGPVNLRNTLLRGARRARADQGGRILTHKDTGQRYHIESPARGIFRLNGGPALREKEFVKLMLRELKA